MRKVLFCLFLLSFLFILPSYFFNQVSADSGYKVVPIIFIPSDYENLYRKDVTEGFNFKSKLLEGLGQSRNVYLRELGGYAFNIDSGGVREIFSSMSLKDIGDASNSIMSGLRDGKIQIVQPNDEYNKVVFLVAVYGTSFQDAWSTRGIQNGYGYAVIGGYALFNLFNNDDPDYKNEAIQYITHELGHSFGIIYDGYANTHTCSILRPSQDCKKGTPLPYPPEEYGLSSIMTYRSYIHQQDIDKMHFNNDNFNPEISSLMRSPFLNPNGDPIPTPDTLLVLDSKISGVNPEEVLPTGTISIFGNGFGNQDSYKSKVNFYNVIKEEGAESNFSQKLDESSYKILSWNDNLIGIQFNKPANYDESYRIEIVTALGNQVISGENTILTIKGVNQDSKIVSVDFTTTCGPSNALFGEAPVRVSHDVAGKFNNNVGDYYSDDNGQGSVTLILDTFEPIDSYHIAALENDGAKPDSDSPIRINIPNPLGGNYHEDLSFHYSSCPEGAGITPGKVIKFFKINNEDWNNYDDSTLQLDLAQLGIKEGTSGMARIPVNITYTDGSSKSFDIYFNYQPEGNPSPPPGVSKECIYSEGDVCRQGNCLDGSQNCGFNDNCGYVEGVSSGEEVDCPADPTPPPANSCSFTRERDNSDDNICPLGRIEECQSTLDSRGRCDKNNPSSCDDKECVDFEECNYDQLDRGHKDGYCPFGRVQQCDGISKIGGSCKYNEHKDPNCRDVRCVDYEECEYTEDAGDGDDECPNGWEQTCTGGREEGENSCVYNENIGTNCRDSRCKG